MQQPKGPVEGDPMVSLSGQQALYLPLSINGTPFGWGLLAGHWEFDINSS
jgi:hypothetical protein